MKIEKRFIAACACIGLSGAALAETPPARTPAREELWVPTKDWQTLMEKHPNAVMLTPEQYEALIRDAGKIKPLKPEDTPPAAAQVESLHFKADARDESSEHLKLEGEMVVRCLTDDWTEVTARMPFKNFAAATVDDGVVLGPPETIKGDRTQATQRKLLVRGKGAHRITFQILGRPGTATLANTRSFGFQTTEAPAVMDLLLPPGAVVTQASASYTREGDTAHVLLQSTTPGLRDIAWTTSSAITEAARQATAEGETTITDHSIETDWRLSIQRSPTDRANQIAFDVIPPDAVVLSVEGEGITQWQQNAGRLEVTLRDRTHVLPLRAKVQGVLDLQASTKAQSVAVPALSFAGRLATNMQTRITTMAEGVTLMAYEGSTPSAQGLLSWNPVRDTLKVLLRKADPRITVDADAQIAVTRDDVQINRTLQVRTDRPMNELRVTLPAGEEFISATPVKGPVPEWKRVGQVVEYRWPDALQAGNPASLTLQSRKRLSTGNGPPTASSLTIDSLSVPEAKKIAGYVALDFDPTWRVVVKTASGLEERDARITPVQGKMAWFALSDYSLAFEVQRREPVFDADITAYALPRAKTVEIEGQITLTVWDAPLRQFKVAVAKERAALVRFTSPLVSEQTLDAASGVWSLTLRKESMGRIPLRFRLSLPAERKAAANAKEDANITIDARLPSIAVTAVRRSHGVWVIEANTDTELTFVPQAMQPLDVLHAPAISDYQPRHRVVAAFDYASNEASLTLHASRHGHSELAALIVNSMRLTSVLSQDGSARHEVTLSVRHSGEQFLNIQLPPGARLLTAIAANEPVKPVRGPDGTVSVPLPADSANAPDVPVRLLYETTGTTWTSRGERQLAPPTLPGNVAILATDWEVFVPDGYSFKKVATEMEQEGTEQGLELTAVVVGAASPRDPFLPGGAPEIVTLPHTPAARKSGNLFPPMDKAVFPGMTEREKARQTARMEDARQAIEKGDKLYSDGDAEAAQAQYKAALEAIPNSPSTKEWRSLASSKYADACVAIAQDRAKVGRFKEAHELLQEALETHPGHLSALTLQKRLNDPDRYPPASTPEHAMNVQGVERSLQKANSLTDLGQYDAALIEFQNVLRLDPYNTAARRGMEQVEQRKSQNYNAARDHRRTQMIAQVDATWEDSTASNVRSLAISQKLKAIRFPEVHFTSATIDEAVEYLRVKSRDLDSDSDPRHRGVNVILKAGDAPSKAHITLDLKDVPMEEALRYVTELAGMKFKVEPFAVIVVPITESTTEMVTHVYKVPPDFLSSMPAGESAAAAPADPFAAKTGAKQSGSKLPARRMVKDILVENGIPFPDGASAVFNPETGQLVIRNTAANIDMTQSLIASKSGGRSDIEGPDFSFDPTGGKSGLLPLEIDIPSAGRRLHFHGMQAPQPLTLNYISGDRQVVQALLFMLAGAALFLACGRWRPVLITLLAVLVLALGVGLVAEDWQPVANAMLLGWLTALVLAGVWKLAKLLEAVCVEGRKA